MAIAGGEGGSTNRRAPHFDSLLRGREEPDPLTVQAGPERIESGWWDDGDTARDYFVAIDTAGRKLWVFRERQGEKQWYLHGLFG